MKTTNSFIIKCQLQVKWVGITNIMTPWSTTDLIKILQYELCTNFILKHWKRSKRHTCQGGPDGREKWFFWSRIRLKLSIMKEQENVKFSSQDFVATSRRRWVWLISRSSECQKWTLLFFIASRSKYAKRQQFQITTCKTIVGASLLIKWKYQTFLLKPTRN